MTTTGLPGLLTVEEVATALRKTKKTPARGGGARLCYRHRMFRPAAPALLCLSALLLQPAIARAADAAPPNLREVAPGVLVGAASDLGGDPSWAARVVLIDPAHARFQVQFDAEAPHLSAWKARFPGALVLLNGSYYSLEKQLRPTCDLVSGGRPERGAGCRRADALVFVSGSSSAGAPRLIPAAEFVPGRWSEAMKSFPALVHAGVPGCSGKLYCDHPDRASAIAWLRDGRIALFASAAPAPLRSVARFFAEKLGAEEAVNLDGGPESTLAVRGDAPAEGIATERVPLPLLLVVSSRTGEREEKRGRRRGPAANSPPGSHARAP